MLTPRPWDRCSRGEGVQPAFKADRRDLKNGLIYETNKRDAPGANESAKMDFSRPDAAGAAPERSSMAGKKGDTPMPSPRHTVVPAGED